MKEMIVTVNGEEKRVWAQKVHGTVWIHHNGETFTYETTLTRRSQKQKTPSENPFQITAPMPGKIIKIPLQPGDDVIPGTVTVVMEAMKMEYALKSVINAQIKEIHYREGDQVPPGAVLITLHEHPTD